MGTNYYCDSSPCPYCGHKKPRLHVGKSSGGWPFLFHSIPEESLLGLQGWCDFVVLYSGALVDEYGKKISVEEFRNLVISKRGHTNDSEVQKILKDHPDRFTLTPEGDLLSPGEFS